MHHVRAAQVRPVRADADAVGNVHDSGGDAGVERQGQPAGAHADRLVPAGELADPGADGVAVDEAGGFAAALRFAILARAGDGDRLA